MQPLNFIISWSRFVIANVTNRKLIWQNSWDEIQQGLNPVSKIFKIPPVDGRLRKMKDFSGFFKLPVNFKFLFTGELS